MSEQPTAPAQGQAPPATPAEPPTAAGDAAEATDWKAEARKWEERSKENSAAARKAERDLEAARRTGMNDAERAIAEAESRGRTAAAADFGRRLARSELNAAAAKRNPDFDASAAFEYIDLSRLLGDDNEPDSKAIAAAVERLVPAPNGHASFDGGVRKSAPKTGDMNSIIRQAAGLG